MRVTLGHSWCGHPWATAPLHFPGLGALPVWTLGFSGADLGPALLSVDHSRVRLHQEDNDYINASLIRMEEAQRSYILTQVK